MSNGPNSDLSPNDLEHLSLEQAANICCVSDERFSRWIEKGAVPVIDHGGRRLIRSHDLIQHLIRHNIPIPDRLLQGNIKKILFLLAGETVPPSVTSEIIWALYRLRKQTRYIFDFVRYDANIELKIITFGPDSIVLLQGDSEDQEPLRTIRKMVNGTTPVHCLAIDRPIDLDLLCNP